MQDESLYILKEIKSDVEKNWKESLIFHTEMKTSLIRIQEELKDLQRQRIEDSKDIEYIKQSVNSHENKFSYIYAALVIVWFFIIWLLVK